MKLFTFFSFILFTVAPIKKINASQIKIVGIAAIVDSSPI
jgi:hypothetical protein